MKDLTLSILQIIPSKLTKLRKNLILNLILIAKILNLKTTFLKVIKKTLSNNFSSSVTIIS